MSERELWNETMETVRAAKGSKLYPKTRKELKELIRYTRKIIQEAFLEAA